MRYRRATAVVGAEEVDVDNSAQLVWVGVGEGSHAGDAGVVDEDVEATVMTDRLLDQAFDIRLSGHVRGDSDRVATGSPDLLHTLAQLRPAARGDHNTRALAGEELGGRPSDASASARNQGHAAPERLDANPAVDVGRGPVRLRPGGAAGRRQARIGQLPFVHSHLGDQARCPSENRSDSIS